MILSIGLSSLISGSEKNQGLLLSELANILAQVRISDYKGMENRLIDALGFIVFNLVKTNKPSVIDHYIAAPITFVLGKFAEHKSPMIRYRFLDLIEKVGQLNVVKERGFKVYRLYDLLIELTEDRDSLVRERALVAVENLSLKLDSQCFGIF